MNSKPQHVLLIGSYAPMLVLFRGRLIRDIAVAGNKISVCAPNITKQERETLIDYGAHVYEVKVQRTRLNPLADIWYLWKLFRLIRRIKPDKVLTYTIKPNIWGGIASAFASVPSYSMLTGLGYVFTDDQEKQKPVRWLLRKMVGWLYSCSTSLNEQVIFQNPDDLNDFVMQGFLKKPEKAALINGSGVDLDYFEYAALPENPSFLMVARLLRAKGTREYAEMAITLKKKYPEIRFKIAGFFDEGPDSINQQQMHDWIEGGLEYLGHLKDIRPAIREASVFVLPSYREGTPRAVLEAMSMGRAIITTDVPGCRETVIDGVNGLMVPPFSSGALCEAAEHLIKQPKTIARMGEESRKRAHDRFEIQKVNRSIFQILGI